MTMNGKALTISAHPDDWELGCGGTIERLKREGCEVIEHCVLDYGRNSPTDNRFDNRPLLTWVKMVEDAIDTHKPDIIFTHYANDLNIDHQITYKAVITAARPLPDCCVKEIYSFEVLSSTEWNFPTSFSPDVFVALTEEDIFKKNKVLVEQYTMEMREWPHPRCPTGVRLLATNRGMQVGVKYAEAFKTVRRII